MKIKKKQEDVDMAKRGGFQGGMPGNMNNLMKQAQRMQRQMVKSAVTEAEKANADVIRCHTSSKSALNDILEKLK